MFDHLRAILAGLARLEKNVELLVHHHCGNTGSSVSGAGTGPADKLGGYQLAPKVIGTIEPRR